MKHDTQSQTKNRAACQRLRHRYENLRLLCSRRLAARLGGSLIAVMAAFFLLLAPAPAAAQVLANLQGSWSGTGTLRPANGSAERIRCDAHYRPIGHRETHLQLGCASDSYKFDLSGQFAADEHDHIAGYWTEHTRGVSGSVAGYAKGNRLQIRAEAPGFAADLYMVTSSRWQRAAIDSHAGQQSIRASITLHRR